MKDMSSTTTQNESGKRTAHPGQTGIVTPHGTNPAIERVHHLGSSTLHPQSFRLAVIPIKKTTDNQLRSLSPPLRPAHAIGNRRRNAMAGPLRSTPQNSARKILVPLTPPRLSGDTQAQL